MDLERASSDDNHLVLAAAGRFDPYALRDRYKSDDELSRLRKDKSSKAVSEFYQKQNGVSHPRPCRSLGPKLVIHVPY